MPIQLLVPRFAKSRDVSQLGLGAATNVKSDLSKRHCTFKNKCFAITNLPSHGSEKVSFAGGGVFHRRSYRTSFKEDKPNTQPSYLLRWSFGCKRKATQLKGMKHTGRLTTSFKDITGLHPRRSLFHYNSVRKSTRQPFSGHQRLQQLPDPPLRTTMQA